MKNLGKSARFEIGAHFLGLFLDVGRMVMVAGEGRDNAGAELVGLRMGQFQRGHLLQMVVQQPGVVDQGLQNQRLPARHRAALAAHDRAGRQLGARRLVGAAVDGLAGAAALPAAAIGREPARRARGEGAAGGKAAA